MSPIRDMNGLPDELLIKIFQNLMEKNLCQLSQVCKRFQKIAEDRLLWKSLYQKVYKYDQPLFYLEPCKFQFESPDVSEYINLWKESFIQLYQGVHVRPGFQNLTIMDHNIKYCDTIHEALSYVKNNKKEPRLIFVHSGTYNVDDTIIIESNVSLIGAATGPKHEIAKSVIINGYKHIMDISSDLKRVYIGYITLQLSVSNIRPIPDCLGITKSTPTIEHCIFRSFNIGCLSVITVTGSGANPLIKNCDISNNKNASIVVIDRAQGIYEDNTISNNAYIGIFVAENAHPIIRKNNIQNRKYGICIFGGTGYFENNNIHNNRFGINITSTMQPIIQKNNIYHNDRNGINIFRGSFQISPCLHPIIRENNVYDNGLNGIYIIGNNSLIEYNSIYDNVNSGININASLVTVYRNKIYQNHDGIYVQMESNSIIQENKVYNNSFTNVSIKTDAISTLKNNQIYGQQIGVHFDCNGYGILEENTIYSHLQAGIKISNGSNPVIRENTIRDNEIGLLVFSNSFDLIRQSFRLEDIRGSGRIEDNDIYDNALVGIKIMSNSDAIVRHNKIYRNGRGISVQEKSRGLIEKNKIYDNVISNVLVTTYSEPILKRNRIHNKEIGVHFNSANGKLEENDIYNHTCSGVRISNGSNPKILGNRIWNNQEGILVCDSGLGFLKQNYIFNSATDNVKIINSNPILEYNQIFKAHNCGINMQGNREILKQNYIFENNQTGVYIATRSQPRLIRNLIFYNGGIAGVEISSCSSAVWN